VELNALMIREIVITFPERKVIGDQSRMKE